MQFQATKLKNIAFASVLLCTIAPTLAMGYKSLTNDGIRYRTNAQKPVATIDVNKDQQKKPKQLLDFSHDILCHIFVCSIDETQNAAEFLKQLQKIYVLNPVCKKFNKIISSPAFARQLGKRFHINAMRIRKWITLPHEPRSWEICSPLHLALEQDKKQLVKTLIHAGADISKISGLYGPMHYVQSLDTLNLLEAAGINVDQPRTTNNRGPLYHIAVKFGENHPVTQKIMQLSNDPAVQATQQLNAAAQVNTPVAPALPVNFWRRHKNDFIIATTIITICSVVIIPVVVKLLRESH